MGKENNRVILFKKIGNGREGLLYSFVIYYSVLFIERHIVINSQENTFISHVRFINILHTHFIVGHLERFNKYIKRSTSR